MPSSPVHAPRTLWRDNRGLRRFNRHCAPSRPAQKPRAACRNLAFSRFGPPRADFSAKISRQPARPSEVVFGQCRTQTRRAQRGASPRPRRRLFTNLPARTEPSLSVVLTNSPPDYAGSSVDRGGSFTDTARRIRGRHDEIGVSSPKRPEAHLPNKPHKSPIFGEFLD